MTRASIEVGIKFFLAALICTFIYWVYRVLDQIGVF